MFLVFEQAKIFQFNSSITTLNMWEPRALGGKIIKICRISGRFPEFEIPLKIKERKKSFIYSPPPHTHTLEVIFRPLALPPEKTCSIFFHHPTLSNPGFRIPTSQNLEFLAYFRYAPRPQPEF